MIFVSTDMPVITSWGQAALVLGGIGLALRWLVPLMKNGRSKAHFNGLSYRDAVAMGESFARLSDASKTLVMNNINETRHSINSGIQNVEAAIILSIDRQTQVLEKKLDELILELRRLK